MSHKWTITGFIEVLLGDFSNWDHIRAFETDGVSRELQVLKERTDCVRKKSDILS